MWRIISTIGPVCVTFRKTFWDMFTLYPRCQQTFVTFAIVANIYIEVLPLSSAMFATSSVLWLLTTPFMSILKPTKLVTSNICHYHLDGRNSKCYFVSTLFFPLPSILMAVHSKKSEVAVCALLVYTSRITLYAMCMLWEAFNNF